MCDSGLKTVEKTAFSLGTQVTSGRSWHLIVYGAMSSPQSQNLASYKALIENYCGIVSSHQVT